MRLLAPLRDKTGRETSGFMDVMLVTCRRHMIIDSKDSGLLTVVSMSPSLALRPGRLLSINDSLSKTPDSHP